VIEHRRTRLLATAIAALLGLAAMSWAGYAVVGPSDKHRQPSNLEGLGRGEIAMAASTQDLTTHDPVGQDPGQQDPGVSGAGAAVFHGNSLRTHQPTKPAPRWGSHPVGRDFIVVVGTVTNLYPGSTRPLPLTYVNPNPFRIRVERITVFTTSTSTCPASAFVTGKYRLAVPILLKAHGAVTSSVAFGMRKSAPDGCQQARVSVLVAAKATVATS
jgi:hypothetical protein